MFNENEFNKPKIIEFLMIKNNLKKTCFIIFINLILVYIKKTVNKDGIIWRCQKKVLK